MVKGISKLILPELPLSEFFEKAKAAGYEAVELSVGKEGEITLGITDEKIKEINGLSEQYGLPIVSVVHHQCTGNLLDSGDMQKKSVEETIKGLEIAGALGAKCTLHTLGRLNKDLYYDKAYENTVASLKMIAPEAKRLGVVLAVEFIWNGFLFSPLEMKALLDEVDGEYVGFYFDPGNMAVYHFPEHWVRILAKYVRMVHMKDWRGNALNGCWPALLKGDVNFAAVMRELRAAGYDGPLISEVDPREATLEETAESIAKIIKM